MIISMPPKMGIEMALAHDEHVECRNATIICDENGEFRGWIDNTQPIYAVYNDEEEDF